MGGADQWGNITAGLELIRGSSAAGGREGEDRARVGVHAAARPERAESSARPRQARPSGSTPIGRRRTRSTSTGSAADDEVGQLLRFFTLLDWPVIEALEREQAARPEARPAQRALALEVTARVHGREAASEAERRSREVFSRLLGLDEAGFPGDRRAAAGEAAGVEDGDGSRDGGRGRRGVLERRGAAADRPGRPLLQRHPRRCGRTTSCPSPTTAGSGCCGPAENVRTVERAD